ncbi:FGGY family carbohydrate kinase [Demequina sp.]|uniref:FGGY family carbohydrate kinase n=1 Tax=Demequina sp. TaxID=2050685 RepID=UPI003A841BAF
MTRTHTAPLTRDGDVIIALDEGTTNAKAVAVDATGLTLAKASRPVPITHGKPGWTEQDATTIWELSRATIAECIDAVGAHRVAGIAISNQRESVACWNPRTLEPRGPVLSWQDTRTADACAQFSSDGAGELVTSRTGLPLDAMFSAPKAAWLLSRAPAGSVVGTIDSWLLAQLTAGATHAIEAGNASRTLLMSLHTLEWDSDLLALFGIPRAALPAIARSDATFGTTQCDGLPAGIPILTAMADSHAALWGHGGGHPGVVKATFGTGSSIMRGTGPSLARAPGVATTLAWLTDEPTYALEGNVRYSGAALDWTARLLGVGSARALGDLAATVPDSGEAAFVPAFGGLGAPHWDPRAVGTLTGLGAGTTAAHIARAAFEAVAMQVADVVDAMASTTPVTALRADGGATASDLLMQAQADALGKPVHVAGSGDVALRGVARLAWRRLGHDLAAAAAERSFAPREGDTPHGRDRWSLAVARARLLHDRT